MKNKLKQVIVLLKEVEDMDNAHWHETCKIKMDRTQTNSRAISELIRDVESLINQVELDEKKLKQFMEENGK